METIKCASGLANNFSVRKSPPRLSSLSFEPSSMIQIVLYRGFESNTAFDLLVGQYEGTFAALLENSEYSVRYLDAFMLMMDDNPTESSFDLTDKKGIPVAKMKIAFSTISTSTMISSQDNAYVTIGGLRAVGVDPGTGVQHAKAVGGVAYEGLKTVVDIIYEFSDAFPPLKAAAAIFRTVTIFVEVCFSLYNAGLRVIHYSISPIRLCWRISRNSKTSKQS